LGGEREINEPVCGKEKRDPYSPAGEGGRKHKTIAYLPREGEKKNFVEPITPKRGRKKRKESPS